MDLSSPYLKRFSMIIRGGTTLNSQWELNYPIILLVTLACTVVIASDLVGALENGISHEMLHGQVYEALIFVFLLLNIPIIICKRGNVSKLIQLLLEPFEVSFGAENIKIAKNFNRWISIYGHIIFFNNFIVIGCCMMVLGPLCYLPLYSANTTIQDLPLPVGRIPFYTESWSVYAAFYIASGLAILAACTFHSSWFLLFVYSSLKIKARLKMLSNTIETLDERAVIRSVDLKQTSQGSRQNASPEEILLGCTEDILGEAISEHIKIMRYVKLVNHTFSLSLMVFIQAAIIVCAILIQQLIDVSQQTIQVLLFKINMTFAGLFSIWVFSVCGQSIVSESSNFRSALYNYNWPQRPLRLKRSLVLMMTVATRTLTIVVGGIYPLSMTSYGTTFPAVYSYITILLYLRDNQMK